MLRYCHCFISFLLFIFKNVPRIKVSCSKSSDCMLLNAKPFSEIKPFIDKTLLLNRTQSVGEKMASIINIQSNHCRMVNFFINRSPQSISLNCTTAISATLRFRFTTYDNHPFSSFYFFPFCSLLLIRFILFF